MVAMRPGDNSDLPDWALQAESALDAKMGFELLECIPERVIGRMPVAGNTQPVGMWHGGASCVLVETLGSLGAFAFGAPDRVGYGIEINVSHHRPASSGWVTGVATAVRLGRSLVSYVVELTDDGGNRVASGRITCSMQPKPEGSTF